MFVAQAQAADNKSAGQELGIYCQGPQLAYKQYGKPVVTKIQLDLFTIYRYHPDWVATFNEKDKPLSDGLMGPITWSWIEHFCRDFALQESSDPVKELPQQLARIAAFAQLYPVDINILTSVKFADWCATREQPLLDKIPGILYQGTDAELLALIHQFQTPEPSITPPPLPLPEPAVTLPVIEQKNPNTLYSYSLHADDIEELKKPNPLPAAIDSLVGAYKSKADANLAIVPALKGQPETIINKMIALIDSKLELKTTYQLDDTLLDTLANTGLDALEVVELNKLPKEPFTDQASFSKAVNSALIKAQSLRIASQAPAAPTDPANTATPVINAPNPQDAAAMQLALMRIIRESRTSSFIFDQNNADDVKQQLSAFSKNTHIPAPLVALFEGIQDIEYPDGQLLHYAVKNAVIESLDICKVNKSSSFNTRITKLNKEQLQDLKNQISALSLDKSTKEILNSIFISATTTTGINNCSDADYEKLHKIYDAILRGPIEQVYRDVLPAYDGAPVKWTGDACGCIPDAIESTAYGIYPYWKVSETPQQFDFSTLSRVGYYGISFNGSGQLTHTNTDNQNNTVLTDDSMISNDFIRVARTYGSKMDWVIEKDWNEDLTGDSESDNKKITLIFSGLHKNLINLLSTHLEGPAARLVPFLSLRIAPQPTKGDGVTFYFKNYPNSVEAKTIFDNFFKELKADLSKIGASNSFLTNHRHHYFVNMIVSQENYVQDNNVFGYTNLIQLLGIDENVTENLTPLEMQEKTKTLILVLLNQPYYNSLAEIYAMTSAKTRQITLPVMFMNYENFHSVNKSEGANKQASSDERLKNLAFIQQGFGGGGFWPMPTWDQKGAKSFNEHLATLFALGYPQSWWAEKLCGYRWLIISVMNMWLLLALFIIVTAFYIYPQQCKRLPAYVEWILKPLPLVLLIFPPLIIWVYLLLVDSDYPLFSLPSLLCLVLIGLSVWAGLDYVKELKQRKPNRNLLQYHKQKATQDIKISAPNNGDDSDEYGE